MRIRIEEDYIQIPASYSLFFWIHGDRRRFAYYSKLNKDVPYPIYEYVLDKEIEKKGDILITI